MRVNRTILMAVSLACIVGLCALLLLIPAAPVEVKVVGFEPARIIDDTGAQMSLVTVSVRNRDSVSIEFEPDRKSLEIKIGDRWIPSSDSLGVGCLGPRAKQEVLFLMPTRANAGRAHLSYQTQNFKWRLWSYLGPLGPRLARKFPNFAKRLLPQGTSMPRPPAWRKVTVEFPMPPKQ